MNLNIQVEYTQVLFNIGCKYTNKRHVESKQKTQRHAEKRHRKIKTLWVCWFAVGLSQLMYIAASSVFRAGNMRWRNLKTEVSLWKRIKMFSVIFYLCLKKTRAGKSHDYREVIVFQKVFCLHKIATSFPGTYPWHPQRNAGVLKFFQFRKASFSWRIRPNCKNKAAFSDS